MKVEVLLSLGDWKILSSPVTHVVAWANHSCRNEVRLDTWDWLVTDAKPQCWQCYEPVPEEIQGMLVMLCHGR
jgi:hypothetical protein